MRRDVYGRKWAEPFHFKLDRQVGTKLGGKLRRGDTARIHGRLFHVDDVLSHDDPVKVLLLGRWEGSEHDDHRIVRTDEAYEVQ